MKIEFGGGSRPRKPTYRQVDVRPINSKTIVCNSWEVEDKLGEGVATDIYSRHFFEHLTHSQACRTLKAWYKISKIGARIELICPNMDFHVWQWLNWDKLTEKEKRHCRAGFWGWQRQADSGSWDLHKSGYNFTTLKELLLEHDFVGIRRLGPDGPEHPHLTVEFYK